SRTKREEPYLNSFVIFRLSFSWLKAAGQEDVHALSQKAGAGKKVEGVFPTCRSEAGFFQEFTLCRLQRGLAGIDSTRWDLPQRLVRRITKLLFQQNAWLRL